MNTRFLRERMKEMKITVDSLAERIGMDRSTLFRKLKDDGETFKVSEFKKIVPILKMTPEEVDSIFFT